MGLFTGLLLLPLAPVRGTMWVAGQILEQVERERDPHDQLRRRLEALQIQLELDEIDETEYALAEEEALAQFDASRPPTADPHAWR